MGAGHRIEQATELQYAIPDTLSTSIDGLRDHLLGIDALCDSVFGDELFDLDVIADVIADTNAECWYVEQWETHQGRRHVVAGLVRDTYHVTFDAAGEQRDDCMHCGDRARGECDVVIVSNKVTLQNVKFRIAYPGDNVDIPDTP